VIGEDMDYGLRSIKNGAQFIQFFRPFLFVSDRRAKKTGIIPLMYTWLKSYFYVRTHGPVYDRSYIQYPFGDN
jgi:hypothetical protein